MMQVKMIKNRSTLIEGEINNFLKELGSVPYTKTSLIDIKKIDYREKDDVFTMMVIYNQVQVQVAQRTEGQTKP